MKNYLKKLGLYSLLMTFTYLSISSAVAESQATHKLPRNVISEELVLPQKSVMVHDSKMSYLELGEGQAVVYIHGNPTSSYLWRNVIPHVTPNYRNIAVDLIGMGLSDKPEIEYNFSDHYHYLSGFIDTLDVEKIVLVGHVTK